MRSDVECPSGLREETESVRLWPARRKTDVAAFELSGPTRGVMVPACVAELGSGGQLESALPGGGGTAR
jgi:hypothetical protein